jgi:hypothetical protein
MENEEEDSQVLRRSKRNQKESKKGGPKFGPPNLPQEKSGLEEFLRSAWKSVRRDVCEQQNSQIKEQWLQNVQNLGETNKNQKEGGK